MKSILLYWYGKLTSKFFIISDSQGKTLRLKRFKGKSSQLPYGCKIRAWSLWPSSGQGHAGVLGGSLISPEACSPALHGRCEWNQSWSTSPLKTDCRYVLCNNRKDDKARHHMPGVRPLRSQVSTSIRCPHFIQDCNKGVCFLYFCMIDSLFHLNEWIKKEILSTKRNGKIICHNTRQRNTCITKCVYLSVKKFICVLHKIISSTKISHKSGCSLGSLDSLVTDFYNPARLDILSPFYGSRDGESLSDLPNPCAAFWPQSLRSPPADADRSRSAVCPAVFAPSARAAVRARMPPVPNSHGKQTGEWVGVLFIPRFRSRCTSELSSFKQGLYLPRRQT